MPAMFDPHDTIVAIATPPGRGGLGVVRLAGPRAMAVARALCAGAPAFEPRHATRTHVLDADGRHVDEVVVTSFPAPHSYSGDDVVEISGHGSPVLLEGIVARAIGAGARLSEPGEFTLRAYLNGRLDLVQAEAVADLIDAVTPRQARAAMDQLDGTLTTRIRDVNEQLFHLIAQAEASLDFPEEGFHFLEKGEARASMEAIVASLDALLASASAGRLLREGRTVVIAGRPNTGKSSLFNALLGRDRAIVTDIPGTTRDVLSEPVDVLGVPVTLIDTAGVRATSDPVEEAGVVRASEARAAAVVVVIVLDGSAPLSDVDRELLAEPATGRRLLVVNKSDLAPAFDIGVLGAAALRVSATTGEGLEALRRAIVSEAVSADDRADAPAMTNVRHATLATRAREAVGRALVALDAGATEELLLVDLHDARSALEAITGTRTVDDLLRHIFGRFCIGK
jgi:tRNA modification GTPase